MLEKFRRSDLVLHIEYVVFTLIYQTEKKEERIGKRSRAVKRLISCVNHTNTEFDVPTCPESLVTFLADVLLRVCLLYVS